MSGRRLAAAALARIAAAWLPAARADWGRAMRRELDEIDSPGEALAFASGCVWTAFNERIRTMETMIKSVRWLVAIGMVALAGAAGASALRLSAGHGALALIFAGLAAALAGAAIWSLLRGPGALVRAAAAMLAIHLAALGWLGAARAGIVDWRGEAIHRALLIEGFAIWSLLLATGAALGWALRHPEALARLLGRRPL